MPREILLVGGGHAHVEVIRRYEENPIPGSQLRVVDPNPFPVYSGMVPGFVAGQYQREELDVELRSLCERAGARFIAKTVVGAREGDALTAGEWPRDSKPRPELVGGVSDWHRSRWLSASRIARSSCTSLHCEVIRRHAITREAVFNWRLS
jgi:hypothetical protein